MLVVSRAASRSTRCAVVSNTEVKKRKINSKHLTLITRKIDAKKLTNQTLRAAETKLRLWLMFIQVENECCCFVDDARASGGANTLLHFADGRWRRSWCKRRTTTTRHDLLFFVIQSFLHTLGCCARHNDVPFAHPTGYPYWYQTHSTCCYLLFSCQDWGLGRFSVEMKPSTTENTNWSRVSLRTVHNFRKLPLSFAQKLLQTTTAHGSRNFAFDDHGCHVPSVFRHHDPDVRPHAVRDHASPSGVVFVLRLCQIYAMHMLSCSDLQESIVFGREEMPNARFVCKRPGSWRSCVRNLSASW